MLSPHLLGVVACALLFTACGKQGEGERCDINSGRNDCETGLLCRSAELIGVEGRGAALCCPPDDVPPTVTACLSGAALPDDTPDEPEEPDPALPDAAPAASDGGA